MYFKGLSESEELKQDKSQERNRILHISESYKNIRANLMFALAGKKSNKAQIIMFTSAEQGDGKTTTCINLTSAFADSNAKVLVVDADLRRPKVERYITNERHHKGLSDVLGGFCTLDEVITRPEHCNFDCLFSGSIPPNPSELMMLESVKDLFEALAKNYDYIFVDTPPVGIVSETLYLTQFVTGVILVVKKQSTHFKKVKEVIDGLKFAKANILGFVLNGSTDSQSRRYYRRGYYYYE